MTARHGPRPPIGRDPVDPGGRLPFVPGRLVVIYETAAASIDPNGVREDVIQSAAGIVDVASKGSGKVLALRHDELPLSYGFAAFDIDADDGWIDGVETQMVVGWLNEAWQIGAKPPSVERIRAEVDAVVRFHEAHPADELYGHQKRMAESVGLPNAWACTTGSESVWLGFVDSGMPIDLEAKQLSHPDLQSSRFQFGLAHARGVTNSGYVFPEYSNWAEWNDYPADTSETSHGSKVLGIATADASLLKSEDPPGIAGVNWRSPVYVVRIGRLIGSLSGMAEGDAATRVSSAVTELALWYRDVKLHHPSGSGPPPRLVMSVSFGLDDEADADAVLRNAFTLASDEGILIVASIGNSDSPCVGTNGDPEVCAPARWAHDLGFVAVASVVERDSQSADMPDIRWMAADHNVTSTSDLITIGAPGADVVTTTVPEKGTVPDENGEWVEGGHWTNGATGTSFAAPMVAGIASLYWGLHPDLERDQVIEHMIKAGDKVVVDGPTGLREARWLAINAERLICPIPDLFRIPIVRHVARWVNLKWIRILIRLPEWLRRIFPIRWPKLPGPTPKPFDS